jgi:hypothetical protein
MRYRKNQTLLLEPEHESVIVDGDEVEESVEPIRVKLKERIHSDQNPFITYWEIKYLRMTPSHNVGDTRVLTENMISNYVVPEASEIPEDTDENILAEPEDVESDESNEEVAMAETSEK